MYLLVTILKKNPLSIIGSTRKTLENIDYLILAYKLLTNTLM